MCRLWGVHPAGDPSKWSHGSADFMNEQIKKASAVYIQDYWNKIEEIEQEKCQREIRHFPLYHQQILELDAIQFTQNVLFCINVTS